MRQSLSILMVGFFSDNLRVQALEKIASTHACSTCSQTPKSLQSLVRDSGVQVWLLLLLMGLAAFILFLSHYLRRCMLRERHAAVLEERSRVARELHDTVIQGCSTVSVLLEAADSMGIDQKAAAELTCLARRQIQDTILEARQAILGLRHGNDHAPNLVDGLRQITRTASLGFTKSVGLEITGEPPSMEHSYVHQLLMVTREALHNALVHAHARHVDVTLKQNGEDVTILVKDDGRGLPMELGSGSKAGHFGLRGMRERMKCLGGSLEIESRPSSGTVVTVRAARWNQRDIRTAQI